MIKKIKEEVDSIMKDEDAHFGLRYQTLNRRLMTVEGEGSKRIQYLDKEIPIRQQKADEDYRLLIRKDLRLRSDIESTYVKGESNEPSK